MAPRQRRKKKKSEKNDTVDAKTAPPVAGIPWLGLLLVAVLVGVGMFAAAKFGGAQAAETRGDDEGLKKARTLTGGVLQKDWRDGEAGDVAAVSVDAAAAATAQSATTTLVVFSSAYREMEHLVRCYAPAEDEEAYETVKYSPVSQPIMPIISVYII